MGWREHVEWLDGNKEYSGDTNIFTFSLQLKSSRKMVSSSRSIKPSMLIVDVLKVYEQGFQWGICSYNSLIGNEGRV